MSDISLGTHQWGSVITDDKLIMKPMVQFHFPFVDSMITSMKENKSLFKDLLKQLKTIDVFKEESLGI